MKMGEGQDIDQADVDSLLPELSHRTAAQVENKAPAAGGKMEAWCAALDGGNGGA
jgi:hypothetical protein